MCGLDVFAHLIHMAFEAGNQDRRVALKGETGESRDSGDVLVAIEGLLEGCQDGQEEAGMGKGNAIAGGNTRDG